MIATAARRAGATIWAYCLMRNPVHLIVTPADRNGLRRAFGEAQRRYNGAINARVPLDRPSVPGSLRCGGDGRAICWRRHDISRYIALNPAVAGLGSHAGDWPWSSARAHLVGEDNELATVAPLRALIPDFAALLAAPADPATTGRIARAPTIGRPLAVPEWIAALERRLGRPLAPGKPGPKPRADRDPERRQWLL